MGNRKEILDELTGISSVIASCGPELPFKAPPGYFEGLAVNVINRIKTVELENGDPPLPFKKSEVNTPFYVPDEYFDGLATTIISRIRVAPSLSPDEELQAISPFLGQLEKKVPFTSPPGYFAKLPGDVISGVNAVDFVNYELETLPPVLNNIKNKNVFRVPEKYFATLGHVILQRVTNRQKAGIYSLSSKNIFRYASAALLAGIMAVGSWFYFQGESPAAVSKNLAGIEKISDAEIEKYLDNTPAGIAEVNTTASYELTDDALKELLSDIPDEELKQYLEHNSISRDMTTN